ncbi:MAG: RNA polymerase sigma factor [Dehalococcoidia bacterium]
MTQGTTIDDEADLVRRLAAYDADAWQTVFRLYHRPLFRLAYVRTFQQTLAEDIAAEVLSEAARGIGRYTYRGVPFRAWLFRIANNLIADHLKAQLRRPQVYLEEVEEVIGLAVSGSFEAVEANEDFFHALEGLTQEQKTALTLRFVNDLNLEETAASMGKSVGAIKQLQHRALGALREKLPREEERT